MIGHANAKIDVDGIDRWSADTGCNALWTISIIEHSYTDTNRYVTPIDILVSLSRIISAREGQMKYFSQYISTDIKFLSRLIMLIPTVTFQTYNTHFIKRLFDCGVFDEISINSIHPVSDILDSWIDDFQKFEAYDVVAYIMDYKSKHYDFRQTDATEEDLL